MSFHLILVIIHAVVLAFGSLPCRDLSSLTTVSSDATLLEVSDAFLRNIAPNIYSSVLNNRTNNSSLQQQLRDSFAALTRNFSKKFNEFHYNMFTSFLVQVSVAQSAACEGSRYFTVSPSSVASLVQQYTSALKKKDNPTMYSALGTILCIERKHNFRQRREESCSCPTDGIFSTRITKSCEFFRCLDPSNEFLPFLEFDLNVDQCLIFAVDTTGSMYYEINAAKQTIRNFLKSEEEIGDYGCYVLVPFNDHGRPNNSEFIYLYSIDCSNSGSSYNYIAIQAV